MANQPRRQPRSEHPEAEVLERGDIFFLYRPKLDVADPAGLDDVQRFHVVLRKQGGHLFRLLTIGRKRLPAAAAHEREWGFVELIADQPEAVAEALRERTYETKTRGTRTSRVARPAGEGSYALLRDGSGAGQRTLFLAYELALPETPGPVQEELHIAPAAIYAVAVKNPDTPNPPGVGLREGAEARYPKALARGFHGRRFGGEDPHLLDFEGAEFVLVGAGERPEEETGSGSGHDHAHAAPDAAVVLRRLNLSKRQTPIRPLVDGEWA